MIGIKLISKDVRIAAFVSEMTTEVDRRSPVYGKLVHGQMRAASTRNRITVKILVRA